MDEHDWLAERFEENRSHLRAVAYRMLGSPSEADDAVQARSRATCAATYT
jgi:DNA-directed RNA polymerase specialized sigma24 family protein